MSMGLLLSLDLSTTCAGYAIFSIADKKLLSYGVVEPDFKNPTKKGIPTYVYPRAQVFKLRRLVEQLLKESNFNFDDFDHIVIEEVNRGIARMSQKTLDGFHFLLLDKMDDATLRKVVYWDSDGKIGWRSKAGLQLQLSEQDKMHNKDARALNKKLQKGQKVVVINQKHLACRFVNKQFGLNLDVETDSSHGDMADAIGLGFFYLTKVLKA